VDKIQKWLVAGSTISSLVEPWIWLWTCYWPTLGAIGSL